MLQRTISSIVSGVRLEYLSWWLPTVRSLRSQHKLWNNLPVINCVNNHQQHSSCSVSGNPISGVYVLIRQCVTSYLNPNGSIGEHFVWWLSFTVQFLERELQDQISYTFCFRRGVNLIHWLWAPCASVVLRMWPQCATGKLWSYLSYKWGKLKY